MDFTGYPLHIGGLFSILSFLSLFRSGKPNQSGARFVGRRFVERHRAPKSYCSIYLVDLYLAANFAPADMRGRYLSVFGLCWGLPSLVGPTLAGLILDNLNPKLVWYLGGVLCTLAALGFITLHRFARARLLVPAAEEAAAV
jgi:MFS family permease